MGSKNIVFLVGRLLTYIIFTGQNGFPNISGTISTCNKLSYKGNITYYINNETKEKTCTRYMLNRENTLITKKWRTYPFIRFW